MKWKEFYKRLSEFKNAVRNHEKNPSLESLDRYKWAYIGMKQAFEILSSEEDRP